MAAISALLLTGTGLSALPAGAVDASPAQPGPVAKAKQLSNVAASKLAGGLDHSADRRLSVFVELTGNGAAQVARKAGSAQAADAARARRAQVARKADSVLQTAREKDGRARMLFEVSNAVPGVAVSGSLDAIRAIAARQDVVKVSPLVPKTVTNASAAQLTRVLKTWQDLGNTGKGVTVGIIDTGLDYTHADFGGPGTIAAWEAAHAEETDPDWRASLPALGKAKVLGGHDFVGDPYDADSDDPTVNTPNPDENPIDCNGHGTHVSGTAAGYGVTKRGTTFTRSYARLTGDRLMDMKVGPGMAPSAGLYALKVFGCEGSTNVVIPALDWSLDPNGDGNFSDHLDIVNLSLGSTYSTVDDPENTVVNEIAKQGVLPVMSAGNNGDLTDTGGSPGNALRSLAVASSVDAYQLRDGLRVNAPPAVAGIVAGQVSQAYDWANEPPVSGTVVSIPGANADGCDTFSVDEAAKVAGKVVWLEWDDSDATRRCGSVLRSGNARAAGAIGAIFTSGLNVFGAGITGDTAIPVFQLPKAQTDRLRPFVDNGLSVTFDGSLVGTIKDVTPAISDTISGFTSRGTHGSLGSVKPDVTAPGDTISSAGVGTGNDVLSISGTSMAAPHTAGISALVRAQHRGWSTEQVKAAVMNTAGHDLFTKENRRGMRYGPARVGAGRVDARSAVSTKVLAYSTDKRGAVSASFGVVTAPISQPTVVKTIRLAVQNTARRSVGVRLSYDALVRQPGVSYTVSPSSMRVKGKSIRKAKVTMTVVTRKLRHTIDPTMERTQLGVGRQFVSDASGRVLVKPGAKKSLRVPVYGAAKPTSQTTASADGDQIVITGKGFSQGSGTEAFRSYLSVLELGDTSGTVPVCTLGQVGGCTYNTSSRAGDLEYVGAGSTSDWLWFGIATHSQWATIGNSLVPYVDFDTDGDNDPDYEVFVQNITDTDILVANLYDLAAEEVIDAEPVNFNFGDVDTNVFDTDVLLIPVFKELINAPAAGTSFPITYTVGMFDAVFGGDIDTSATVAYDANDPEVQTNGPLYRDRGGAVIDARGASADAGTEALVLHLHGAPGQRAEVVALDGTPAP